jgi:zinc transporter, ZIP family
MPMPFGLPTLGAFALPVVALAIGGVIATMRPPGPRLRSALLHLAAGVVFAVVAVELLPDLVRSHAPRDVAIGFTLGVASLVGLRAATAAREPAANPNPAGLLATVGVDLAIDGLLLGIAFAAGATVGRLLALALTIELLSLGLAVAVELGHLGIARRRVIAATLGLGLLFVLVAAAGASVFRGLSGPPLAITLAFGAAALLFLVTEELLVEAHQEPETPLLTATFFVGFLLMLLLGMLR